ncbi:hypothetical protein ACA910_018796 [Epithemia clementina (nom. ined.)]
MASHPATTPNTTQQRRFQRIEAQQLCDLDLTCILLASTLPLLRRKMSFSQCWTSLLLSLVLLLLGLDTVLLLGPTVVVVDGFVVEPWCSSSSPSQWCYWSSIRNERMACSRLTTSTTDISRLRLLAVAPNRDEDYDSDESPWDLAYPSSPSNEDDDDDEDDNKNNKANAFNLKVQQQYQRGRRRQFSEEEEDDDKDREEHHLPTTGFSLSDELDLAAANSVGGSFVTDAIAIPGVRAAAQLVTRPVDPQVVAFEPMRYLVALDDNDNTNKDSPSLFALIDIPPYSPELVTRIQVFMEQYNSKNENENNSGSNNATTTTAASSSSSFSKSSPSSSWLVAILVTSSDAIYVDETPTQIYSQTRRAKLVHQWQQAFPKAVLVVHRIETPRECVRSSSSSSSEQFTLRLQRLDGQGPFGYYRAPELPHDDTITTNSDSRSVLFEELGRPLSVRPWDYATAQGVWNGTLHPETFRSNHNSTSTTTAVSNDNSKDYSRAAIRQREDQCSIVAVCTPGHAFGSLSFVFPNVGLCASGYTLPVEDERYEDNDNTGRVVGGPALDVRGYITTSRAGVLRQMQSARQLVQDYSDRCSRAILPSRGNPLVWSRPRRQTSGDSTKDDLALAQERKAYLLAMIDQYDKIGQIYEQLGITTSSSSSSP